MRPGFHVTPQSGWINDPLGVTWHEGPTGGRYEMFVQYNPAAPEWSPACGWGQMSSPDLVRWEWVGVALTPGPDEVGCWSGAVVVDDDGAPSIFYTRVAGESLDVGSVVRARGDRDWSTWVVDPGEPVVAGPPDGLPFTQFRDPAVRRDGDGWSMVIGGGLTDGRGTALSWSSPDLSTWTFDGVLAERPTTETDPVWTGSVWECVQLFPLEDRWVLLLSVWHDGLAQYVACSVGDLHDGRFQPSTWQRFTANDALYATTSFLDDQRRRSAVSWVRESAAPGPAWAGALSLPVLLGLDGDRVTIDPHPDVDTLRSGLVADLGPTEVDVEPVVLGPFDPFLDIGIATRAGAGGLRLTVLADGVEVLVLASGDGQRGLTVGRPGRPDERLPDAGDHLRLLLDAGLAEVFSGGDTAAVRVDVAGPVALRVSAPGGAASLQGLTVHTMERFRA
ncbi:glycoside hydrolase family 32 protein [Goekera deserti]|uniref:beta-fructofuranosidase n=1 Tax=Goekera deserti TaxID=2497753 RepID=A0A7K3WCQ3_9ACTN|nr:glycoside hydrolase family 32 protein [Goekera deserti]NDI47981.1 hypothetical protein [Goekera deserti]NEL53729.1 glycoside hydrolase family 32 protein [Goekera deserti]